MNQKWGKSTLSNWISTSFSVIIILYSIKTHDPCRLHAVVQNKSLTSHQYSQWVPSFDTPYSWRLHKQIVIDRGRGVSLDSQSKQLYMKSKSPGWMLSHTQLQRFNRHLNSTSASLSPLCYIATVKGPCNIVFLWRGVWEGRILSSLLHHGWVPSIPAWAQEPAVFLYQYCCKATENSWKWKKDEMK